MNDLHRSKHLTKAIFHFFHPRRRFTKRNGHHARSRYFERYGVKLSESDYELLNLKVILGDFKLIASEKNSSAFYSGIFKDVEFFAIFNPHEGMIVTFLEEGMIPCFMKREEINLFCLNNDFIEDIPRIETLSNLFLDEEVLNSELCSFDSLYNVSVYRTGADDYVLFDHNVSRIKRVSSELDQINSFIELNYI